MGSHMRSIEPWLPPWLLNQSAKEMLSRARMSLMPPSGSTSALTMGDVPRARLLATLSFTDSCGVVKNAFNPEHKTHWHLSSQLRLVGHYKSRNVNAVNAHSLLSITRIQKCAGKDTHRGRALRSSRH